MISAGTNKTISQSTKKNHEPQFATQIDELLGKPLVDPATQEKTDWMPMSVHGREDENGVEETPTAWFAYNRATREPSL